MRVSGDGVGRGSVWGTCAAAHLVSVYFTNNDGCVVMSCGQLMSAWPLIYDRHDSLQLSNIVDGCVFVSAGMSLVVSS